MSKIAVLGAGVVGSAYAALLAGGGHEVTLIARGERYRRLTKGLRVHLDAQVLDERIAVSRSLAGVEHDTLVVAVRGDQLADALGAASTSSAPAVLLFSNPLGLREAAEQALGRSRTVWCFSGVGGLIGAHGVMAHHVKQQPTVVEWGQPCSGAAVDLLSSTGLQLRREPRMSDWLNTHTLFVAALASTVLMRPMETRRDRLTSARELTDGMREGIPGVGAARTHGRSRQPSGHLRQGACAGRVGVLGAPVHAARRDCLRVAARPGHARHRTAGCGSSRSGPRRFRRSRLHQARAPDVRSLTRQFERSAPADQRQLVWCGNGRFCTTPPHSTSGRVLAAQGVAKSSA